MRIFPFTELEKLILTLLIFAFEMGLTAGAAGRQGMLTPPRHLISPLVFPGVRVSLAIIVGYSIYLIYTLTLTTYFLRLKWGSQWV
jgi:hypothetical protein